MRRSSAQGRAGTGACAGKEPGAGGSEAHAKVLGQEPSSGRPTIQDLLGHTLDFFPNTVGTPR